MGASEPKLGLPLTINKKEYIRGRLGRGDCYMIGGLLGGLRKSFQYALRTSTHCNAVILGRSTRFLPVTLSLSQVIRLAKARQTALPIKDKSHYFRTATQRLRLGRRQCCASSTRTLVPFVTRYRSEGFALTGYVVPGCVEDGAWMLWGNSSVVVAVVAVVLALSFLDNFSKKSSFLVIFHQKLTFCDILFLKVVFSPKNFRRRHACPHFSVFSLKKICIFYQIVIMF